MASKQRNAEEAAIAVVEEEKAVELPKPQEESVYSADELANNYKVFKTSREVVAIALRLAGKETATLEEAKTIINKFKKEVR